MLRNFRISSKLASVVRLWYPSLATTFLARWRIRPAARVHGLPDRWEPGAVAAGTSLFSRICRRLFHPNLFHSVA
jgi:hypothetical protein